MDAITKNRLKSLAKSEWLESTDRLDLLDFLSSCRQLWNDSSFEEAYKYLAEECEEYFNATSGIMIPVVPSEHGEIPKGHVIRNRKGVNYLYKVIRGYNKLTGKRTRKYKYLGKHIQGGEYHEKKYTHKGYSDLSKRD